MNKYNEFKNGVYNLEASILSCILLKPELMEETILTDKYFAKYGKLWKFMKIFYARFGNFDVSLMATITNNKYMLVDYILILMDTEPTPANFKKYELLLIELYNEEKKERWKIEKIYNLANELLIRNISTVEFADKISKIDEESDFVFKDEK